MEHLKVLPQLIRQNVLDKQILVVMVIHVLGEVLGLAQMVGKQVIMVLEFAMSVTV